MKLFYKLCLVGLVITYTCATYAQEETTVPSSMDRLKERITSLQDQQSDLGYDAVFPRRTQVLKVEEVDGKTEVTFNEFVAQRPLFERQADELMSTVAESLEVAPEELEIFIQYGRDESSRYPLHTHVTTRKSVEVRVSERTIPAKVLTEPVVQRSDYVGPEPTQGLLGRNVVIAPSHGWTWHKENRWQFQRARLQTTIEDMFNAASANQFLMPMLENAGAVVWPVRERDYQTAEVIVDNDRVSELSEFQSTGDWQAADGSGWLGGVPEALAAEEEPFTKGTALRASVGEGVSSAVYTPYIPRDGRYAVYASWVQSENNSPSVPITVKHRGGETEFHVNQQVAGNTWVLLGFFEFDQGTNENTGSVTITTDGAAEAKGADETFVTADAIRFGGGIGNVSGGGQVSNKPRHAEAARYWLQYSGAPADIIYNRDVDASNHHFGPEYVRDYIARTEWTNWLTGAPWGPNDHRDKEGLGVPVDLYLSWHSDAGVDHDDVTGTHLIYSSTGGEDDATFPDNRSRWLSRDFASIVQEEILRATRTSYSSTWPRRSLHNRRLSETTRANAPSALIELLAHQNLNDMKYGLDPRYRFDVSRGIYKAILKFIAASNGYRPVFQPMPPTHVSATQMGNGRVRISWQPQSDPVDPDVKADGYIVYSSQDGKAFDNGQYVEGDTSLTIEIPEGEARYFRVTAANRGGQSFPSPVVGAMWKSGMEPILVVDGFNRLAPPSWIQMEEVSGFDRDIDPGVGYEYMYGVVGDTYDYDKSSPWKNDLEAPGWGAASNELEERMVVGNGLNNVTHHGKLLSELGRPFDSATAKSFGSLERDYALIDWIAGFQKLTNPPEDIEGRGAPDKLKADFEVLTEENAKKLKAHVQGGGKILMSGAYAGADLLEGSEAAATFAEDVLGISSVESGKTLINSAIPEGSASAFEGLGVIRFGLDLGPQINLLEPMMKVHSAEQYQTTDSADPLLRYPDSGGTAASGTDDTILIGFPIQTVVPAAKRLELYKAALNYLESPARGAM